MQALLILNLIGPFVMVFVGASLKKHPVSDMQSQNGYNTPVSRKSQEHWDYAQNIAPDIFILFGKYLFIAEILGIIVMLLFRIPTGVSISAGTAVALIFLIYAFYYTDKKIKKEFAER